MLYLHRWVSEVGHFPSDDMLFSFSYELMCEILEGFI